MSEERESGGWEVIIRMGTEDVAATRRDSPRLVAVVVEKALEAFDSFEWTEPVGIVIRKL